MYCVIFLTSIVAFKYAFKAELSSDILLFIYGDFYYYIIQILI